MLRSLTSLGSNADFVSYLEADFLQPAGHAPFRWRQYWGELRIGKWRLLGGQAWSLLRPDRQGTDSYPVDLFSTLVVEPAYHVGLTGVRRGELRLTGDLGHGNTAAVAWTSGGRFEGKFAHDWDRRVHLEAMAYGGTRDRLGFGVGHSFELTPRVRLVGAEFWSRGGGPEILGILNGGVRAYSVIEGVELPLRANRLTLYSYGGIVYAARNSGNRMAREYTVGARRRLWSAAQGQLMLNAQFSQLDRAVWDGRSGSLTYVMGGLRYAFPPPR